jgi:diacylglycerol kinase family enzyme
VCRATVVIVIYNPTAGQRRTRVLWRVLDILSANGVRVQLAETRYAGHAAVLAREAAAEGRRLIVAAGGDGTIAEVAGGINGSGAALGVIPLGTANVLARELALPFSASTIASALAFGRTRVLWPGMARLPDSDRLFVQMLGVGLDAQVVHRLPLGLKRMMGRNAYVAQTLREMFRYGYRPIRLRIDGKMEEAGSVVVTKGSLYAGQYLLAPGAKPSEPGFTVALFGRNGPGAVLMYGAALTLNLLPRAPGMRLIRAREVDILEGAAVLAQADGDPAGGGPITVRDAARPINVVVS